MMNADLKRLDDENLCILACSGNPLAMELIVKRWERNMYSLAIRMLLNREDAEDATQEIFLKIFTKIHTFNGNSSFKTWLYSVALNLISDYRRKKNRKHQVLDYEVVVDDVEEIKSLNQKTHDPYEETNKKQSLNILKTSISKLPEKQRTVLVLKEYNELTFEEIADVIRCPVSTVKSRLYKGLENLKQIYNSSN
jgi:RNA polymerase sigma-70 factor (ECF subfamily)